MAVLSICVLFSYYLFNISFKTISWKYGYPQSNKFFFSDIYISVFLSIIFYLSFFYSFSLFIIIFIVYYDLLPRRDDVFPSVTLLVSLFIFLILSSTNLFYFVLFIFLTFISVYLFLRSSFKVY